MVWLERVSRVEACCRRGVGALALLACLAAISPPALAAEPTDVDKQRARALAEEGDALFAEQSYEAALARFVEAYRLVHVPTVGIEVARTQVARGRWLEGKAVADEVAALPAREGEPPVFGRARAEASELAASLAERIPSLSVSVAPAEAHARLELDGRVVAIEAGTPLRVDPGHHRLLVSAPGFVSERRRVHVVEAEQKQLTVALAPIAPAPVAASPAPAAGVTAEGALLPVSVPAASPAAAGETPAPPQAQAADEQRHAARTRGHIALGMAIAGGAVGTVAGLLAFSTKPDCPRAGCPVSQRDAIQKSLRYGNVANVSFAIGGVALAYGLWEVLVKGSPGPSEDAPATKLSVLAPSGRGLRLQLSGRF